MTFYVTTPIYYVNATPHVGHAYTTIAADILARNRRQRGEETFFLTGTDEHGSNIARVAEEEGLEPKAFVDRNAARFLGMTERINVSNDFFVRTTDERHEALVQEFLQRIYDAGEIYEGVYAGLYCSRCESFYTEAELVDDRCPQHGIVPEFVEEKNYFFRLSAYQERLLALYDANPDFVLPHFRANEARSFIAQGLDDISVSRATQRWGVAVPWDPDQVVYVWVDALINYWSALAFAREGEDLRPRFWPEVRHLLAKDILKFHCVIWPALLMGAGIDVPRQLFVHGYLLMDDRKMSKSVGNVIDPLELIDVYGVDPVRYYLFRAASFGQDGNISVDGLHERYERELGNDLGNLLSRTTAMIARYRDGTIPAGPGSRELGEELDRLGPRVADRLDAYDLTGALDEIWETVRTLNRHVEQSSPWELAKDDARAADLDRVLFELADGLRVLAIVLSPFLPETGPRILAALGQDASLDWDRARAGQTLPAEGIEPAQPLFPRVDAPAAG
ncbi:MAG TPA: methionine--tRNA ligase [Gaiellaceae bacterium]|nr:methionine--tRNA ligase [Gaiellaceae bacterium]